MNTAQRIIIMGIAGFAAVAGITVGGPAGGAQAATAAACDSYGAVLAGQGMECSVIVDNYDDGITLYSTVTVKECHGAPFTILTAAQCTTVQTLNTTAVTAVSQCNSSLNGGGSSVVCSVRVNNHFAGNPVPVPVDYEQCVGSGAGGTSPVGAPLNCSPPILTLGAPVNQCNGSVNGGGGPLRVNCDVDVLAGTAQLVTVNQCNGTANGGGSVLFCSVSFGDTYGVALAAFPGAPAGTSVTTIPTLTGGTYGTPGGPSLAAGRFIAPPAPAVPAGAGAAASARTLALSGTDSTVPLITGSGLVLLGAGAVLAGRRRIRRPAHRMG